MPTYWPTDPRTVSFLDLLKPYYEREIIRLRRPPRAWRSTLRNTRQAVLDHLLLFMLWGALDTDDPLVKLAIRRAGIAGDWRRRRSSRLAYLPRRGN